MRGAQASARLLAGIAVLALAIPWVIDQLPPVNAWLWIHFGEWPLVLALLRFVLCAVGERVGASADCLQLKVCDEFIGNKLSGEELGNSIDLGTGYTHEEGKWVENVPDHKLEGEFLDPKAQTDPGEQAIDHIDQCENSQDIGTVESVSG